MSPIAPEDATAQHVRRTLRALELLAEGPQTQAALARHLGVHRRTARRLLARLADEGYAEPAVRGRHVGYRATSRLAVVGRQVADGLDIVAIGRRHLAALGDERFGARFVALREASGVALAYLEEPPAVGANVPARVGPLHATAAGKVFLSADTALVGDVLNQELLAFTASTLVTRGDLLLELATVRARGYATEVGEHHAGVRAVASGVVNHVGATVVALGATAAPGTNLDQLGELARDAARACSQEIGGSFT